MRALTLGLFLVVTSLAAPARAIVSQAELDAQNARDEERLAGELQKLAPDAVDAFKLGSEALNQGRAAEAEAKLASVHQAAPGFTVATHRLCLAEAQQGKRQPALSHCREAARDETAASLAALAAALLMGQSITEREEAHELAKRAAAAAPASLAAQTTLCTTAANQGDVASMRVCTKAIEEHGTAEIAAHVLMVRGALLLDTMRGHEPDPVQLDEVGYVARRAAALREGWADPFVLVAEAAVRRNDVAGLTRAHEELLRLAPDDPRTHAYGAILGLVAKDYAGAQEALDRGRAAGLDKEQADKLQQQIDEARPTWDRYLWPTVWVLAGWAALWLVLIAAGLVLSRVALRGASAAAAGERGMQAGLASAYRGVLWCCCLFYYTSLPIISLAVLAAAGGVIIGTLALGYIVPKLLVVAVVGAGLTLYAIARSVFSRGVEVEPGQRLDLAEHPELRAVLDEVAEKLSTRAVDTVYLAPGTQLAVFERGGLGARLRASDHGERCLILGAGVLADMPLSAFKAVLAHEYGHFVNRDTAGGSFALAVRRSMSQMAQRMIREGVASWINPAWLFLQGFVRVFLRVSHGASRLQEVLADRWAAHAYGAPAFVAGLRHVIDRSVRFDARLDATLTEVVERRRALANLYRYRLREDLSEEELEEAVAEAMDRAASAYDSHPAPQERIAFVEALAPGSSKPAEGEADAWSLLRDRRKLERAMTAEVRERLAQAHGIVIAASKRARLEESA